MKGRASELAALMGGQLWGDDVLLSGAHIDSRRLLPGQLFVALKGGEAYAAQALARGAGAVLVPQKQALSGPQIVVPDPQAALTAWAKACRDRHPGRFFALTGSNGKTSSRELLSQLLAARGKVGQTLGNFNNDLGVPLSLLALDGDEAFVVLELGANHPGEIARLTRWVRPEVTLVTNVSGAHLAGFGSLEGVAAAKEELYAESTGAVVINADLPYAPAWLRRYRHRPHCTFGRQQPADIRAEDCATDGAHFKLNGHPVHWGLRGLHQVDNALGAVAAARFAGLELAQAAALLATVKLSAVGRLRPLKVGIHTLYDDSYNANPASFRAALDLIAQHPPAVVFAGAMAELGPEARALHQSVAQYAAAQGIARFIAVGTEDYGVPEQVEGTAAAGAILQALLREPSPQTVLIKGSRSARMERILATAGIAREE